MMQTTQPRRPKLIVFDLDNTLWTPELYQLRKLQRNNQTPIAHKDVKLFPGAKAILQHLHQHNNNNQNNDNNKEERIQLAIASRTKSGTWAKSLLDQFDLMDKFDTVQIFSGDKRTHFGLIQQNTQIAYRDMMFFDDARDGKYGNCVPVSELGVLACHCPNGLESLEYFEMALKRFEEWDGEKGTLVEWDGSVTKLADGLGGGDGGGRRQVGTVKKVFSDKGYGFLSSKKLPRDVFFHFNDLPTTVTEVKEGDKMSFVVGTRRGKPQAQELQLEQTDGSSTSMQENHVELHAFSMNMPFAALLANGYKNLETRNGTMFVPYKEGTKFLLHVGQRIYPDGDRHLEIMKSGGLDDTDIAKLKALPNGYGKGMAVAVLEIGKTYETTLEERSDPEMQRRIGAYGSDSGMRCTEIRRVEYLKQPVRTRARGGVFKVKVDPNVVPPGWLN